MKSFSDLGVFAAFLVAKAAEVHGAAQLGLRDGADIIEHDAKRRIGEYQPATGPFPAWAPLADSTLNGWHGHPGKVELGYAPPDNPLLREGDMRDSIGLLLTEDQAVIGSDSHIAVFQETGTHPSVPHDIPPRPFLGPAGFAKGEAAAKAIALAVADSLAGIPRRKPDGTDDIPF